MADCGICEHSEGFHHKKGCVAHKHIHSLVKCGCLTYVPVGAMASLEEVVDLVWDDLVRPYPEVTEEITEDLRMTSKGVVTKKLLKQYIYTAMKPELARHSRL